MSTQRGLSLSWLRTLGVAGSLAVAALLSADSQAVLWTNAVNVVIVNGPLRKTAGCDGCDDAGATSQQLMLDVSPFTLGATVVNAQIGVPDPPPPDGGLLEESGSQTYRRRFTRDEIQSFLPANDATGRFRFPAPYGTTAVRLTNANDCGGADCLAYVGYSYWRNTNNHVGRPEMLIFLGFDRSAGGAGPSLLSYDKTTDQVRNLGPLFPETSVYSYATGEGWYFSGQQATKLYTYLVGDSVLQRYDVLSHRFESTAAMDLRLCPRPSVCPSNAAYIFQPHSSDDDATHSATVQDAAFNGLGCVVYKSSRFQFFAPSVGFALDECQVDKSGNWLLLLEVNPNGSVQNRIVDLLRGTITTIDDVNGSLGHLDMGYGYAVGADNYNPDPNATILLKFPVSSTTRPVGPVVHYNKRWDIAAANHIAHGNAIAGTPPESQYACGSNASRVPDMADEIVCFPLNGSLDVLVVGQVMTDLDATGGRDLNGDDYTQLPKGNLDVTGRYFIWTTNMGGDRLDAFLVKVPWGAAGDAPINSAAAPKTDFDHDSHGDLAVFRPSNGIWYVRQSHNGYSFTDSLTFQWGLPGDTPIAGDFDGDAQTDLTVWRPSNGTWYIRYSSDAYSYATWQSFQWGLPGDIPVSSDFDGDGRTDLTVWRPSDGTWYIRYSSDAYSYATWQWFQWGLPGDIPVSGDFDGDGRTDLAVWRPSNGTWYIRYSSDAYSYATWQSFQWGLPGDIPVTTDFDGDGRTDLAVWRPSNGTWYIRYSADDYTTWQSFQWGLPGDIPVPADIDGDGRTDLAVWRPSDGTWYMRFSSNDYSYENGAAYQWGLPGDIPIEIK